MINEARKQESGYIGDIGIALPLLFLIINFSDSYLLGHYTTFLFVYFAAIVFSTRINEENSHNNSAV